MSEFSAGCWVSAVNPSQKEVSYLIHDLEVEPDFIRAALDEEESSRIESEDNQQTLVIIDIPFYTEEGDTVVYSTIPVGIIITKSCVITICLKENRVINDMTNGVVKGVQTQLKTRFMFQFLLRVATHYLAYLKQIDKITSQVENELRRSMKNQEIMQLMGLQKSLVYFSTSLKADELTLEKILRGRMIKLYEEDQELLEDVLIEIKQAIEMANIYSSILQGTTDAFSSVISNNLNQVMKVLTSLTIVLEIPTVIFSFYGMNVDGLWFNGSVWFALLLAVGIALIAVLILNKKNMFK